MIVAGHQPNYLPWLGFFDKLSKCDVFIIEDSVQYVHREYQNRNRVKTSNGVQWLTVPVVRGRSGQRISEVRIQNEEDWARRHWLTLQMNYSRAPYWDEYSEKLRRVYETKWNHLMDLNMHLIREIMRILDIDKELVYASSLEASGRKTDLVIAQCKALNADTLLSGAGAKEYLDVKKMNESGVRVVFQEFKHPEYRQLWGGFEPNLSAVDYILCAGNKPF